jgi:hypothetical protein
VARAANRLDIRRLIGGLFILYGLILLVLGLVGSDHIRTRQPGSTSTCRRRTRGVRVRRADDVLGAQPANRAHA